MLCAQSSWAGATATAKVTVNGPAVTMAVTSPGTIAKRTFAGTVGQSISVVMTNVKTTDDSCSLLAVTGPGGSNVGSDTDCEDNHPSFGPFTVGVSGTYTVEFSVGTTSTGSGKLEVSAPVVVGKVTVNGPQVAMKVTRLGQGVERTFTGTAGQSISVVMTNVTATDDSCSLLAVTGPGDSNVGSDADCEDNHPSVGPFTVSVTGTYTVEFSVGTTSTGSGTLQVST
jgi:hypothetical protein